jgi:2-phospho-L-lactate guanylyltransferase
MLVEEMADHVVAQLQQTPSVEQILVLSPERLVCEPATWIEDRGRGLNAELAAVCARLPPVSIAIVHADLPFLVPSDTSALLVAAHDSGAALAPDRRERGTNALAIADGRQFIPQFGPESFSRHRKLLPDAAIIRTEGLSFDLDEEEDLEKAAAMGVIIP